MSTERMDGFIFCIEFQYLVHVILFLENSIITPNILNYIL